MISEFLECRKSDVKELAKNWITEFNDICENKIASLAKQEPDSTQPIFKPDFIQLMKASNNRHIRLESQFDYKDLCALITHFTNDIKYEEFNGRKFEGLCEKFIKVKSYDLDQLKTIFKTKALNKYCILLYEGKKNYNF